MKRIFRAIILFLILSGLIFGAVALVNHKKKELSQAPKYGSRPRPVTVATAAQGTLTRKKSYLAVVQPVRKTRVSAQVQSRVASVLVDEGDTVNPDQALVRLDSREIKHSLASVRARIEEAGAELAGNQATVKALKRSLKHWQAEKQRYQALSEKELASKSRAESAAEKAAEVKGRLNAAKEKSQAIRKRIESLRQQEKERQIKLEYHTLVSPYQGIVTERLVDPGELATPSKVLLVIEDMSELKLSFDIPQNDLPAVRKGQDVIFSLKGRKRQSHISLMYPSLNQARMMRAEAFLDNSKARHLVSGQYVPVSVTIDVIPDATLVPRSALISSPQGQSHVFIVKNGRLGAQSVDVLGYANDQAAVTPLQPGTQVVQNTFLGWALLSSGMTVEAIQ